MATDVTPAVRRIVYMRDGFACLACGSSQQLTIGHRVNRSTAPKAIKHTISNLVTQCWDCNTRETMNAALAEQFREWGHNLRSWEIPLEVAVYVPVWGQWRLLDDAGHWRLVSGRNP
jgi:5-methylcytosine-specific restriction endonuclease McrA